MVNGKTQVEKLIMPSDMANSSTLFSEALFENQVFKNISAPRQEICCKEFSGCVFKDCDLGECNFSNSSFTDCTFSSCNLSNIKIDNCRFRTVVFEDCKIVGVLFERINPFLLRWIFKECKIELCDFSGLKMTHRQFIQSFIRETDFINTNLRESSFAGSDLQGSKFHNVNLEKATFVGARNYYIDPTVNRLKHARFSCPEVVSLLAAFDIKVEY